MPEPTIYVIAGCNGAGKTTFAREFLPHEVKCLRFYNADEMARGLSPLDPSAGAIKAGRLLLNEIQASIDQRKTFALESTLKFPRFDGQGGRSLGKETRHVQTSWQLQHGIPSAKRRPAFKQWSSSEGGSGRSRHQSQLTS